MADITDIGEERDEYMKKITLFYMKDCPYCRAAFGWIEKLLQRHPEYKNIEFETVEENENRDTADKYDYYYVPAFYPDGEKVHEGAASKKAIKRIFAAAYDKGE